MKERLIIYSLMCSKALSKDIISKDLNKLSDMNQKINKMMSMMDSHSESLKFFNRSSAEN